MKIGFACKYKHPDQDLSKKELKEIEQSYNGKCTTLTWLNNNEEQAYDRLYEICLFNVQAIKNLVSYVASLPEPQRMLRISSEILPMYSHKIWSSFYKETDIIKQVSPLFDSIGKFIRKHNIKTSMHPGPYCVLASDRPEVVEQSIIEFEAHADIIRMMGFGRKKMDFKCNIHLTGKGGASQFRKTFKRLSPEARNTITLENDEFSSCLDEVLTLSDIAATVLDIHHYWISTGTYISHKDSRLIQIEDSWQGVRPTIHYSYSRDTYVEGIIGKKPCLESLLSKGLPRAKLRAHSESYPNMTMNRYALDFLPRFDIMCEAKTKNEASTVLYNQAKRTGFLD
jgi:UV DNA damage repair endonuclease